MADEMAEPRTVGTQGAINQSLDCDCGYRGWVWSLILAAVYCAIVLPFWNRGYLDFGDGNYMYISWRLAHGAVLYRDILAPQPPMHFLAGVSIVKMAELVGADMLFAFRTFSMLLHVLTLLLVIKISRRVLFSSASTLWPGVGQVFSLIGGAVYLVLPLGFWWSLGYQSEPLETVFLLASILCLLREGFRGAIFGGVFSALACLTNMTAAPVAVVTFVYLLWRKRNLVIPYAGALAAVLLLVTGAMELATHSYLDNVILNQVGSFPRKEFLPPGQNVFTYAMDKIWREGGDVLALEGTFIGLALLGWCVYLRRARGWPADFLALSAFVGFGSIIYVSKGGTEDYIFTLGEPFVAAFAAFALFVVWKAAHESPEGAPHPVRRGIFAAIAMGALLIICIPGLKHSWATLHQRTYELNDYETQHIVEEMQRNSKPDGLVLSPPFYAFLAKRKIAEDYSELFLWSLKYWNEKQDKEVGRGRKVVEKLAELLRERKIDYIALDLGQTGRIPEIREQIEANYRPLRAKEYQTLNTRLQFYVPKI